MHPNAHIPSRSLFCLLQRILIYSLPYEMAEFLPRCLHQELLHIKWLQRTIRIICKDSLDESSGKFKYLYTYLSYRFNISQVFLFLRNSCLQKDMYLPDKSLNRTLTGVHHFVRHLCKHLLANQSMISEHTTLRKV